MLRRQSADLCAEIFLLCAELHALLWRLQRRRRERLHFVHFKHFFIYLFIYLPLCHPRSQMQRFQRATNTLVVAFPPQKRQSALLERAARGEAGVILIVCLLCEVHFKCVCAEACRSSSFGRKLRCTRGETRKRTFHDEDDAQTLHRDVLAFHLTATCSNQCLVQAGERV